MLVLVKARSESFLKQPNSSARLKTRSCVGPQAMHVADGDDLHLLPPGIIPPSLSNRLGDLAATRIRRWQMREDAGRWRDPFRKPSPGPVVEDAGELVGGREKEGIICRYVGWAPFHPAISG